MSDARSRTPLQHNRSMPDSSVIPVLPYADLGTAVDWLVRAFGLRLRLRIGDHRAQLEFGNGAIVAVQQNTAATAALMLRVSDIDAHCAQARNRGARILQEPTDFPYGERQYSAADCAGHLWTFSQTIADADPADWGGELLPPD